MTDHSFLEKVGMAFLLSQNCFQVATEIRLPFADRQYKLTPMDKHFIIDVCGLGKQYVHWTKDRILYSETFDYESLIHSSDHLVSRGLEVKISRSDFRNGFVCSGCNYHYLLVPKGLIEKKEVPKNVGLVEYDEDNFSCNLVDNRRRFQFTGLHVSKNPRKQKVGKQSYMILLQTIAERQRWDMMNTLSIILKDITKK